MIRLIIFILIISFYLIRYFILSKKNDNLGFLFVSLFVFVLPSNITFFHFPLMPELRSGAFNMTVSIEPYLLLSLVLLFWIVIRNLPLLKVKISKIILAITVLFIVSLLNEFNYAKIHTLAVFLRFLLLLLSFYLIICVFSKKTIFKGIYDGLLCLTLLQLILAICYPVLGMEWVLSLFKEGDIAEWATGEYRGGRLSAIGTFTHPGNLALFMSFSTIFFYSCYIYHFHKKQSLIMIICSIIVLVLTFSRSGLLAELVSFAFLYVLKKNNYKSLFSLKNVTLFLLASLLLLFILISFTSLGEMFSNDDFESMKNARFIHWFAGFQIIEKFPLLGVGINSHLYYFSNDLPILTGFFAENPIHNIHIIFLTEIGIVGYLLFLLFVITQINKSISFIKSNKEICQRECILNFFFIGSMISWFIYGFFGWAPLTIDQISIFLFIIFMSIYFRNYKTFST